VLVQKAMSALRSDRTSFIIAHRLSTIRDADLILGDGGRQHRRAGHAREPAGARWCLRRLYNAQFTALPRSTPRYLAITAHHRRIPRNGFTATSAQ
jgi:hypothetical protein